MSDNSWYKVYKVKFALDLTDPDMEHLQHHTIIFVETHAEGLGTGDKHHVTGDLVKGMVYKIDPFHNPLYSNKLHSQDLLGYTHKSQYPEAFTNVLRQIPAPPKQKAFNMETKKTAQVKFWDPLTFYEPHEDREPLMNCMHWVEEQAVPVLLEQKLIVNEPN